jgi:DNA (cytosine-5)-methyltransferase 1
VLTSVELFAGAGGLGLGLSLAGFQSKAVVEWDRWATDTLKENQRRGYPLIADWPVFHGDVRAFPYHELPQGIDLVSGGPPCQPFSMGGKHRAHDDHRDMFPAAVDVVRQLQPRAFIIENVKGLTRSSFANYYSYILLQLENPEVQRRHGEEWFDHFARLQREHTSGKHPGLTYNVVPTLVNAANHGVPQKRERVFIVGFRNDLQIEWSFPEETHSHEALLIDQWVTSEYWDRHKVAKSKRPVRSSALDRRVENLRRMNDREERFGSPWMTVRDAFEGMPEPSHSRETPGWLNHRYSSGARSYTGHTGSPLDLPAKTLKAGDHGVPGGENMLVRPDGSVRYFTAREAARLQTFPDTFRFHGSWSETMRQLGNAVPVALAHKVAASVASKLLEYDHEKLVRSLLSKPVGSA